MAYPEIRDVAVDAAFVGSVRRFVDRFELPWRTLSKIPRLRVDAGGLKRVKDLATIELLGRYGYLATSSAHAPGRALAAARLGVDVARAFELLCLNYAVDERDLAFAFTPDELDGFAADRVLIRQGTSAMMTVTVAPYGDRYYLGDAWHLKDNHEDYGRDGAPLGFDTWLQIEYVKRRLGGRRIDRMLEIGPGTGIVLGELRALAAAREGGEYSPRTLEMARGNVALWEDHGVTLFESNLLSGASGKYDLIMFNPWQPSEDNLHLILPFIEQSEQHLTEGGAISLLLSVRKGDGVMEAISDTLAARGLVAERDIVNTFASANGVVAQCFCWITRGASRSKPITDTPSLPWLELQARQLLER